MTRQHERLGSTFRTGGVSGRPAAAGLAALVVAACATHPIDPAQNRLNRQLNSGGDTVTGSIESMNRDQVRALATSFPVCLAYQLPSVAPALNGTFKRTLADITGALRDDAKAPVTIAVYQAQLKKALNPLAELVALKSIMPAAYRTGRMDYQPLPAPEFRKHATCAGKDTVLVVGSEVSFYRKELPLATVVSGELPIDTILFMVLDVPKAAGSERSDTGRPS